MRLGSVWCYCVRATHMILFRAFETRLILVRAVGARLKTISLLGTSVWVSFSPWLNLVGELRPETHNHNISERGTCERSNLHATVRDIYTKSLQIDKLGTRLHYSTIGSERYYEKLGTYIKTNVRPYYFPFRTFSSSENGSPVGNFSLTNFQPLAEPGRRVSTRNAQP